MKSYLLQSDADIQILRDLVHRLPDGKTVVDFEEKIQVEQVRAATRIWQADKTPIAFAFVDDFSNLMFVTDPAYHTPELETEIVDWALACVRKRNMETGESNTLDAACKSDNLSRLAFLERHGFQREEIRSLGYRRPLDQPIAEYALPEGFSLRPVHGEAEVEDLVALHRSAFGTDNMTVEYRLAMMRAPQYLPELDLVAVAPNGELAAFCICGFMEDDPEVGFTDPIGTREGYKGLGLGRAIVTAGLKAIQARGAKFAELGTSSKNLPMQRLAESLGFELVSETLWFSKRVD
jgi:ribosomal protein S18 acetylase RimI-like enzyme